MKRLRDILLIYIPTGFLLLSLSLVLAYRWIPVSWTPLMLVRMMENRETEGYELPETGGIGTTPYTMGGLLLMTVGALFLLLYKNKKHGKVDIASF